jgi:hypothetical protein
MNPREHAKAPPEESALEVPYEAITLTDFTEMKPEDLRNLVSAVDGRLYLKSILQERQITKSPITRQSFEGHPHYPTYDVQNIIEYAARLEENNKKLEKENRQLKKEKQEDSEKLHEEIRQLKQQLRDQAPKKIFEEKNTHNQPKVQAGYLQETFYYKKPQIKTEEILKILRTPIEKVSIYFPYDCKDSPILKFSMTKFNELYILNMYIKDKTDLSALGKQDGLYVPRFEKFPRVQYFSSFDKPCFQTSVRIKEDDFQDLYVMFKVAETLDKIDPEFISFIKQLIDIEAQYRKDASIRHKFDDLIPDQSMVRARARAEDESFFGPRYGMPKLDIPSRSVLFRR